MGAGPQTESRATRQELARLSRSRERTTHAARASTCVTLPRKMFQKFPNCRVLKSLAKWTIVQNFPKRKAFEPLAIFGIATP